MHVVVGRWAIRPLVAGLALAGSWVALQACAVDRETPRGGPLSSLASSGVGVGSTPDDDTTSDGGGAGEQGSGGGGGAGGMAPNPGSECDDSGFCDVCAQCAVLESCSEQQLACDEDVACTQATQCLAECNQSCASEQTCYEQCRSICQLQQPGYVAAVATLDCWCRGACVDDCSMFTGVDCLSFAP